jgi:hypothetical protein
MAGRNIVDEFFIAIGMDTSDVDKNINGLVDNVSSKLSSIAMGVIAPALAAITSGQIVQQFTQEIIQIDRLSESLGINIEKLQQWQGAAERAGVAGEEVGELFADLNDWMIDVNVNQSGPLKDFIEKGILPAVEDAQGKLKTTEQYALDLSDAFQNMGQQQATGVGRQIGIGRADVVAWLQQGSAGINAQLEHVKRLGVYTKEDAKAAKEFTNASNDLARAMKMMLLPVYRVLAPIATKIAEGMSYLAQHAEAFIPVLIGLGVAVAAHLLPVLKDLFVTAQAFLLSPWGALLAALLAIGLVFEDFMVWLEGGESAFGDFYEAIFGSTENAKAVIDSFVKDALEAFEEFKTVMLEVWTEIKPHIVDFGELLLSIGITVWNWAKTVYDAVWFVIDVIRMLVSGSKEATDRVANSFDKLKNSFSKTFDSMKDTLFKWWDFVAPIFNKLVSFFGDGNKNVHLSIDDRRAGAVSDNSSRTTDIKQSFTFNGVKDAESAGGLFANTQVDLVNSTNPAY